MTEGGGAHFDTRAVHAGRGADDPFGATSTPIYQNSAFEHASAREMEEVFSGRRFGFVYSRLSNPTVACLERKLAALEGGIGAVACASGMAAIAVAITGIASRDDEIVAGSSLFGGTYSLFARTLRRFGIRTKFAEPGNAESFRNALSPRTRLIFVETVGNPKLDIPDIRAISSLAHRAGVPLIVDSTLTTPFLFRPKEWGADIVVHSSTKFLNGHGNSIGGVLVDLGTFRWETREEFEPYVKRSGDFAFLTKIRKEVHADFGPCLSPFNAFLTVMGIETMGLRMRRHCDNALALAKFLADREKVAWVNYPGLPGHPQHRLAASQFGGRYGALLTLGAGNRERAYTLIDSLKLAKIVTNLGDARTMAIHPASNIYADFPAERRVEMGVMDDMVRVSVGIEDIRDIIADFAQAIN